MIGERIRCRSGLQLATQLCTLQSDSQITESHESCEAVAVVVNEADFEQSDSCSRSRHTSVRVVRFMSDLSHITR